MDMPPIPDQNQELKPAKRQSLSLKILFIALITLVLLIPDAIIYSLNTDRRYTQEHVTHEISKSWSGPQTISGPIISIPYHIEKSKDKDSTGVIRVLPAMLDVNGNISSQKLSRSIYETVVYNSNISINGNFDLSILNTAGVPLNSLKLDKAYVTVGIGDLKGLESASPLKLGNASYSLNGTSNNDVYVNLRQNNTTDYVVEEVVLPDEEMYSESVLCYDNDSSTGSGCMQASINLSATDSTTTLPFSMELSLKGSESIGVTPIGGNSDISLKGECAAPSFGGMFIPSKRTVENGAFDAQWQLNSNNRQYPQVFKGGRSASIARSAVVVNMIVPVDHYLKVARAIKYAIVVILLTFISVLLAEVVTRRSIHLLQYLLIGLALILFYSLLLSLSEHIDFGISYFIAALLTIGLVTAYMWGILKSRRAALTIGTLLTIIYAFIYVLLCLETFALLTGSIGMFIALGGIMWATLRFWK